MGDSVMRSGAPFAAIQALSHDESQWERVFSRAFTRVRVFFTELLPRPAGCNG